MKNRKLYFLTVLLAFAALTCIHPYGPTAAAEVQPIETSGASYGEWGARWWEWALSIPDAQNPISDTTGENCAQGQVGNVWFLAGTGGGPATRVCTIPKGKAIFFPLINGLGFLPSSGETTLSLRQLVAESIDSVTRLKCKLDGKPCAKDLFEFRSQSPIFEAIVPADGLLGNTDQTFLNPLVADGYWLLLSPLRSGHHILEFSGETPDFSTSVKYHLTVH